MSKTLNKTITSTFFTTESGYDEMRRRWSVAVNDKNLRKSLTLEHHLLYLILSGKDLSKSFSPITNKVKLDNGARPFGALESARLYSFKTGQMVLRDDIKIRFKDILVDNIDELIYKLKPVAHNGDLTYKVPVTVGEGK